jgi:hypothetical protein
MYLSDMWLGVELGTNTKNTLSSKEIRLHAQSKLTLPGLIVNMYWRKITLLGLIVSKNWTTCRTTSRAQGYSL